MHLDSSASQIGLIRAIKFTNFSLRCQDRCNIADSDRLPVKQITADVSNDTAHMTPPQFVRSHETIPRDNTTWQYHVTGGGYKRRGRKGESSVQHGRNERGSYFLSGSECRPLRPLLQRQVCFVNSTYGSYHVVWPRTTWYDVTPRGISAPYFSDRFILCFVRIGTLWVGDNWSQCNNIGGQLSGVKCRGSSVGGSIVGGPVSGAGGQLSGGQLSRYRTLSMSRIVMMLPGETC